LFRAGLAMPGASDGGLPPAMPGSGGWITAENMHEFFDADGNWIGGEDEEMEGDEGTEVEAEILGPGAGTVRTRDDEHDGNGVGEEETKWQRTD
jgi:chloride channel, nucleotide-sensitive, 1A